MGGDVEAVGKCPGVLVAVQDGAGVDEACAVVEHVHLRELGRDRLDGLGVGDVQLTDGDTVQIGQRGDVDVGGDDVCALA
ncbi:hypothetical protein D3C80_1996260 [compost metagenome]